MKVASVLPKIVDSSPYVNLLNQRLKGQITKAEFDHEIACGAYGFKDDLYYQELPDKPADLREFIDKWKYKSGVAKDKLRTRIMSSKAVVQFMDEYYGKIAQNKAHSYWLEQYIVIFLVNLNYPFVEGLRGIYLRYPSEMRYIDGMVVWRKKAGSWWSQQVDEYRRSYGFDEGSGSEQAQGTGGELQPGAGQDEGPVEDQQHSGVSEAVPF